MHQVAFVTCARLPHLDVDDQLVVQPLAERGCRVTAAVWDDPDVDWDRFDLSVIRSTWDYTDRRDEFIRWTRSVPRLLNPSHVVEWNTDKRYLDQLAVAGVSVVPTKWISDVQEAQLPAAGDYVLKPSVGAGSLHADRFNLGELHDRERAAKHVDNLLTHGQTVMVQPFAAAIERVGETGVILVDTEFSHAIHKAPMLGATSLGEVDGLYKEEKIQAGAASSDELDLAHAAMDAAASILGLREALLFARVDMVPGTNGLPMVMELELTEPSLFMATTPGSEQRFASAVAARAKRRGRARAPARRARPQQERVVS